MTSILGSAKIINMLIDPISGFKMKRAQAKGGVLWYCPYSRGRALTVACAKKFLGVDGTREIWVRSGLNKKASEYKCPSCTKNMIAVQEPKWMEGATIDVCRACHMFFIEPDEHNEVPHPEDFINQHGDSSVVARSGEAAAEYFVTKHKHDTEKKALVGGAPEKYSREIITYIGLPAEISDHGYARTGWISIIIMMVCALLYIQHSTAQVMAFGFIPAEPFKNWGINIYSSVLVHGGLLHLLFNLYFFNMFSDDVEENLGPKKYLIFLLLAPLIAAIFMAGFENGKGATTPHVGLSGLVMACLVYYALQFPKSRLAYLFPAIHTLYIKGGGVSFLRALRWVRVPVWAVAAFYILKDFAMYKLNGDMSVGVSYTGHLGGALAGLILWATLSHKPDPKRDYDVTGEIEITPGRLLKYQQKNSLKNSHLKF